MSDPYGSAAPAYEDVFDVVVVGGGTAGCVVASRLTEDPDLTVCLVEGGPSDVGDLRVAVLRDWLALLGSELDYDYRTVDQPRGNSHIRHSRARVLGGCSSHNTMISFRPLPGDLDDWVARGAAGWSSAEMAPYWERLLARSIPVHPDDRNALVADFVHAASRAAGVPVVEDFNAAPFAEGAGFFSVGYDPATGHRLSASVAYLHPHLDRPNLTLELETWALRLQVGPDRRVGGVHVRRADGSLATVRARSEVVVCAGAIDTPRLLLLSGIGPARELAGLGIEPVTDLPGVGANLLDHPESIMVWETREPVPTRTAMHSDAGLFVRRDPAEAMPDLMFHLYQIPFCLHTGRLGYPVPDSAVCLTPNVPRPRSSGRLRLVSPDPAVHPELDFGYFTDAEAYDERTLVDGMRLARRIAATEPFASWLAREVAPGPDVVTEEELSAYARGVAHTVYHPVGTCRMGAADDPGAVLGADLRVRGVQGLRVADASVFPSMPTVNPMVAVLMVGEKAADLVRVGLGARPRLLADAVAP